MSNHAANAKSTLIKEAIEQFLLSCKVEGKSYGTIECYSDKLKGFLWYAENYDWPDDISAITTHDLTPLYDIIPGTVFGGHAICVSSKSEQRTEVA